MDSFTILRVWAAAAWADGTVKPAEAAAMRRLLEYTHDITPEERAEAAGWVDVPPKLDLEEVRRMRPESREGVLRAVHAIVKLDRQVTADEQAFLERLRAALELDPAIVARILGEPR